MTDKEITIDALGCNNCPDKKRCDEQRERKDNIINSMLNDIKDTAIAYHCDLKDKIKVLKQNLPINTRYDVVLEKQLLRKTQECEIWKNQVLILDGEDVTVQLTQEQFEEYNQLKSENDKLRKERNRFKKQYRKNRRDRKKLEQALEWIRYIARTIMDDDVEESPYYWDARQILQTIDEVE